MAQRRLMDVETSKFPSVVFFYLDLIAHRDVSNHIAQVLQETHQSPQILVIDNQECVLEASHMEITAAELEEVLN